MKKLRLLPGFTTVELLASAAITTIFSVAFVTAFHVMQYGMWQNKIYFDANTSAKNVMDRVAKDTQEACNVATSWGGNSTGNTTLVLRLPSIDATGTPTNFGTQYDYVTYRVNPSNSTQLLRSVDVLNGTSQREGGTDKTDIVVGRKLSSILFSYNGTGLGSVAAATLTTVKFINVQITTQGTTVNTTQETTVDSDLTLKNRIS